MLPLLGLHCMPTVSTISRQMSTVDDRSIRGIRGIERLQQNLVIEALVREQSSNNEDAQTKIRISVLTQFVTKSLELVEQN